MYHSLFKRTSRRNNNNMYNNAFYIAMILTWLVIAAIIAVSNTTVSASSMTAPLPSTIVVDEKPRRGLSSSSTLSVRGATATAKSDSDDNDINNNNNNDPFDIPFVPPSLPIHKWPHQSSVLLLPGRNTFVTPTTSPASSTTSSSTTKPSIDEEQQQQQQQQQQQEQEQEQEDQEENPLPFGIPVPFETSVFRGQFLVRLRNHPSDDRTTQHNDYFQSNTNCVTQFVIQGQFKKPIPMNEIYVGSVFRKPMKYTPPPMFLKLIQRLFHTILPGGVILDFYSKKPRMIALYGAAATAISIDIPGQQPNILSAHLPESIHPLHTQQQQLNQQQQYHPSVAIPTKSGGVPYRGGGGGDGGDSRNSNSKMKEWTIADRKRILSDPEMAGQYTFDTEHVYTIEVYDESVDYGSYEIKLPLFSSSSSTSSSSVADETYPSTMTTTTTNSNNKNTANFNFGVAIGNQPMTFTAYTKQNNEIVFDFALWHESVVKRCCKEQQQQQHRESEKKKRKNNHSSKRRWF